MSYGGMCICCNTRLTASSDIKMVLTLSLLVQDQSEVYAKVLRTIDDRGTFRYPIEFTSIDSHAQQTLKEFVDGLVARK
jgi:c-di-GMP-binding flagellar brake protein YcgR